MSEISCKLLIIGGGPGGYAASGQASLALIRCWWKRHDWAALPQCGLHSIQGTDPRS